jgi:signal transduction histidine kinase
LARQLAAASEYGLFSVNIAHLQTIARGALRESDVQSVAILDADGKRLVSAGKPAYLKIPFLNGSENVIVDPVTGVTLLLQPIIASEVKLDGLFEQKSLDSTPAQQLMGHVLLEFSRETVRRHEREMLWAGAAITLGGLLFGGLLALRLGRAVLRPILRVSDMVERIGRGELSARAEVPPDDPLRDLQLGLNQMAQRLESGRDEMEQRIASATLALREKKEEAETATLAKSRFLAAASHDLRQPTHALGMFVARLGQLPHTEETKSLIGNLESAVQAMQDLLDGLLDISRLDAMAVQVQLRPFALADIFEQVRSDLALEAAEKGLRLRVRSTGVDLLSDPHLLHRILLNLVGNGVRYTRNGGVLLACRVAADARYARIEVWDSGIGIAPEHHQAIFKEFYQVGNLERDRGKGLGLGLNIVERTAQLLGHRMHMCSRPGMGTRFSIEVPLAPIGATINRTSAPGTMSAADLAGLVVLVIEDDAMARDGLVSLLLSWGSVVVAAEGLATAQQQLGYGVTPDLIISDYRLRGRENGIDTVHQLRAAAGHAIPACLMSGDTDPSLMQAAKDAGLTLLHKPVRPAKLRSLIRRLASQSQADDDPLT